MAYQTAPLALQPLPVDVLAMVEVVHASLSTIKGQVRACTKIDQPHRARGRLPSYPMAAPGDLAELRGRAVVVTALAVEVTPADTPGCSAASTASATKEDVAAVVHMLQCCEFPHVSALAYVPDLS
mmetsp:Transcript_54603/g.150300  ORF Transcript_54603/g.150300 Transcript_54603/m.150300 type:complete len:126 (+) Transcript_54603:474-851(+)